MARALSGFLSSDHARLDGLLLAAAGEDSTIGLAAYDAFRGGLLRHISIEERVLFPELRKRCGETALIRQLHRDHAALAALLAPPPTAVELGEIAAILRVHNGLEESPGGLYELLEELAGADLDGLMRRVNAIPAVPTAPHADTPALRKSIELLLREASGRPERED